LTEHKKDVLALILLKNNSLVSGSSDKTIKVWNQKNENTFECIATLNHDSGVLSLTISGSSLLVSGHGDGTIQIRNQTSFVLLQTLKGHSLWDYSIILLNNGNLASGSFQEIKI
jgi:WD40 repeat protein